MKLEEAQDFLGDRIQEALQLLSKSPNDGVFWDFKLSVHYTTHYTGI